MIRARFGNNGWLRAGPVELAAVGVSIALFNQISRIAIFPLVSVTTSFVAEEDAMQKARLDGGSAEDSEKQTLIPQKGEYEYMLAD